MAKEKFTATIDLNYTAQSGIIEVDVLNKCNRTVEVVIKGKTVRFDPYEKKKLTEDEVASGGFKSAEKYFTIIRGS